MPPDFTEPSEDVQYVLDGGALLHIIPWERGSTYDEICQQYVFYVEKHYNQSMVVFDGYLQGPSTKDATQQRRTRGNVGTATLFESSIKFNSRKDDFLSNKENKQCFINLLGNHLERHGCHIENAEADAYLLIVQCAIAVAKADTTKPTILVADDTDVLLLLCYHLQSTTPSIYFRPEPRKGIRKTPRFWNIAVLRTMLGEQMCSSLLFVHVILGCDTTSQLYGRGKKVALKLICTNPVFQAKAGVFGDVNSTKEQVTAAGERATVTVYGVKGDDNLDFLRLQQFHQKVGSSTSSVKPEVLPPTLAAAKYHSMRVFLQVQQWMGNGEYFKPEEWGWLIHNGMYIPVLTDMEAVPVELLEVVQCNSKMGCGTRQCTCRKNDLDCTTGCGQCRGVCTNMTSVDE